MTPAILLPRTPEKPSAFSGLRRRVADFIFPEGVEQRDTLARAANTDPLTGLANRRAFELAQDSAERDSATAFVVFDANNFKAVNDYAGHLAGDAMLREVARVLSSVAERYGVRERVFRVGGDEFVILAPEEAACGLRDECEAAFGEHRVAGHAVSISGTCGGSFWQADNELRERKEARKGEDSAR